MSSFLNNHYSDLYQVTDGTYRHSIKNKDHPQLRLALINNHQLPYTTCNQLLGFSQSEKQSEIQAVYHPVVILPHKLLDSSPQCTKLPSSLIKSVLTAQSDHHKLPASFNKIRTQQFLQGLSNSNQKILNPTLNSGWGFLSDKNSKSQDLRESRLMYLSTSKANQSGIKTMEIPLGYEIEQSKSNPNSPFKNLFDPIQLPQPQQSKQSIHYAKKLVTLFQLKNSQSKDDLYASFYSYRSNSNHEDTHLNFGKTTESKIMVQNASSDGKKDNKIGCSLISDKFLHDSENDAIDITNFNCLSRTQKKETLKESNSILFEDPFELLPKNGKVWQNLLQNNDDDYPKPKEIRGIRKNVKNNLNGLNQENKKRLETPKFGKNFSFK